MLRLKTKKAIIKQSMVGLLVFSLVMIGFFVIPFTSTEQGQAFLSNYGFNNDPNITGYDVSKNISSLTSTLDDDILGSDDRSVYNKAKDTVNGIIGGGYGALNTLSKVSGYTKNIINLVADVFNIPRIIVDIGIYLIVFLIGWAIINIVFNRIDA